MVEATTEEALGFDPAAGSARGNSTCRHCGTTVDVNYVKKEGVASRIHQQLMSIVCTTPGTQGKTYLANKPYEFYIPNEADLKNRLAKLCEKSNLTTPNEPLPNYGVLGFRVQPYGLLKWSDLFTLRQLLALMTFVKWVRLAHEKMMQQGYEEEFGKAIATYLSLGVTKVANRGSNLGVYHTGRETIKSPISNGRLPMCWDFPETNLIGSGSGNRSAGLDWTIKTLPNLAEISGVAVAKRYPSQKLDLPDSSLDAVITDPPYFDSVPYADLSDFFYVWLKRSIGHLYPEHFASQLTPKKNEAIMEPSRHGGDKAKAAKA